MDLPPPSPHAAPDPGTAQPLASSNGSLPPPPPLPPPARGTDVAYADTPSAPASRLGAAWRWTLGIGWCIVLAGLGALAQSAFIVDADPWWLVFKPLPFALPVALLLALIGDSRWSLPLSGAATALLWVLAAIDATRGNSAVAIGEVVCAGSATLLTLGALLGRERSPVASVPDSPVPDSTV